jgi:esterase/lipase/1-acyl-sn-glycerol-3-phosphate acyltransferase
MGYIIVKRDTVNRIGTMNPIAYRTTGLAIKTLENLSKARVELHGTENIPKGSLIFVINHFTRLETFLMPYYLFKQVGLPIWSLAASELFVGAFGRYLESVGAVSTDHPDRDRLIVRTLLANEAGWIVFPEGRMVKSKKIVEKGRYMISYAGGKHPPHTGAAFLALRTEFYRQRLLHLSQSAPQELARLLPLFNLATTEQISRQGTFIVPVNITYYPLRARVNILNQIAQHLVEHLPDGVTEELMTEGAMLISGVDIDIRFGDPIDIAPYLHKRAILDDLRSPRSFDFDDTLPCLKALRHAALKIMKRYMDAIYALTTVNHDHVFASLLKHSPTNTIDLHNFRRRAFLIIAQGTGGPPVPLHHSLRTNQSHLLLEDSFNKLADFLSVAEEKGVLVRSGATIRRNRPKLSKIFDFNRARIDNPIAVIANEVEPLVRLQKRISRLAWLPGFMLRRRLVRYFRENASREFEADYHRYYLEGESKPMSIGRPELLRGRSRSIGVVLSHGYMAAPEEVRTLAEFLAGKGFWVYTPRLKGHGTAPEDLARCSYQDWIFSMEEGYLLMRNLCRKVVLGGFSTGAALALELASRTSGMGDVLGVFAVSTPLRLQYLASKLVPVVDTWNRIMEKVHLGDAKREFVENQPENPHINYLRNPIAGVRELERLMDYLEPKLSDICVPALVVQSSRDPVVNPSGSTRLFELLGSEDKRYEVFNYPRHGILLGEGSHRVHRVIGEFIEQLASEPAARPEKTAEKN